MIPPPPQIRGLSDWRPIARGGLAMVWEATDGSSDRRVAVKIYHCPLHQGDPRHFLRETAAARRLAGHPGVVATYSSGVLPDVRPYLVMELCPGGSLTSWLEAGNHSQEQVRQVGLQVADTLAAAHAAGILHRDVKPANILIDAGGKARLADFGLAVESAVDADPPDARWMTPSWAPPEALRLEPATEAGDVFSLAATLYALLAGRPPRALGSGDDPLEELVERAREPVLPIPGVTRPLMAVLLAALDDAPAARPSAASLFAQLATVPLQTKRPAVVRSSAPHPKPPQPTAEPEGVVARPPAKRRRGLVVLAAASAVVVASAVAWVVRVPAPSGASSAVTQGPAVVAATSSAAAPQASSLGPPAGTGTPGDEAGQAPQQSRSIRLAASTDPAKPFQAAQLQGTYAGGANTLLRVERWEQGRWLAFPVPTKTDQSGSFVTYVELGQRGRYRLRVLDPGSGVRSDPVVLVVEG